MLNVNQITSILERLPDAQLQQYAAMHKQDPYVLSLAVEESNRRKRMRAAPPPQQQQGEPPPVNEQAVQAMAPEDTGIAQLPVGNMDFADGGIVAFAEGSGPYGVDASRVDGSGIDFARERRRAAEFKLREYGSKRQIADPTGYMVAKQEYDSALAAERSAMAQYQGQLKAQAPGVFGPITAPLSRQTSVQMPLAPADEEPIQGPPAGLAGLAADGKPAPSTPPARPAPPAEPSPTGSGAGAGASSRSSVGVPTPVSLDPVGYMKRAQRELLQADPAASEIEALREAQTQRAAARNAAYQAALPKGEAHTRLETDLKKEESEAGAKKEENIKMALINAGLGMLAGTSQYAAVNIGEGAKQGVRAYVEGKSKLELAAEKRRDLYDKIEQARRAEQEGRAKDALTLAKEVDQIDSQIRTMQIDGTRKMTGMAAEQAKEAVEAMTALERQKMQVAATLENARISANSQSQSLAKTALMEYGRSLRMRFAEIEKSLRDPVAKFDEKTKAGLESQRASLLEEITGVDTQLANIAGITPRAPAAGGASRKPDMKFDNKGNPIP